MTVSTPMMRALAAAVEANVPALIWGEPGQAKSAKVNSYAAAWGRHCEVVVGSVRESSDYLGLPIEIDGEVVYSPPAWAHRLNDANKAVLFLDELTTAAPSVQKAMLRIMQERFVGEYELNDSVAIIAAANPPETAADGWDLPAPVANRVMHLDWHFDIAEWLNGVGTMFAHTDVPSVASMLGSDSGKGRARVVGSVTAFLKNRPDLLTPPVPNDPVLAGKAWASPRSWTNAIDVLAQLDPTDEDAALLVIKGCVGEAAGLEYLTWLALADLFDPEDVMNDPSIVDWADTRPDRLFALVTAITVLTLAKGDKATWRKGVDALIACADGKRPDVALHSARVLLSKANDMGGVPKGALAAFGDLLATVGRLEIAA